MKRALSTFFLCFLSVNDAGGQLQAELRAMRANGQGAPTGGEGFVLPPALRAFGQGAPTGGEGFVLPPALRAFGQGAPTGGEGFVLPPALRAMRVQSEGRVKPFDTFARETLRFVSGRTQFQKKPATAVLMSWLLFPEDWDKKNIIHVPEFKLKKAFQLNIKESLFSPGELLSNPHFIKEIKELDSRLLNKVPLDDYFKALAKVKNRLLLYQAFQKGKTPGWIPADSNQTGTGQGLPFEKGATFDVFPSYRKDKKHEISNKTSIKGLKSWRPLADFTEREKKLFQNMLVFAYHEKAVWDFQQAVLSQYPVYDKWNNKISAELHYNFLNPFRLAWILYLLGLLCLLPGWRLLAGLLLPGRQKKKHQDKKEQACEEKKFLWPSCKIFFWVGLFFLILAFCMQGYGMALRSYIMSRPPVTNMYETVIWVPWVTVVLGFFLWIRQKMFSVFVCSAVVALFCLLLADMSPELLDGSLHPLEAVLRSSFWLVVHVLTITMSYGAFFLAFALGNVVLFLFLRQKNRKDEGQIKKYIRCMDRSLQVGVVLLTAGTILGGVWADYSWGRFWGWDPKETWALISLLAYVALLHSRLMGYVREFGMAVGSVLLFFFIVMAWYGVNYVLGEGLHSYGFGAGGVEYVLGFAFLQVVYVLCVYTFRPSKQVGTQ